MQYSISSSSKLLETVRREKHSLTIQARRHGGALGCRAPLVAGGAPPHKNPAVSIVQSLKPLFLGNFVNIRSEIFQFIMLFTLHKLTRMKT